MSTEDRLTALERSWIDLVEAVRIMHEGQTQMGITIQRNSEAIRRVEESNRQVWLSNQLLLEAVRVMEEAVESMIERQAEVDVTLTRALRYLEMRGDNGNQQ